MSLQILHFEGPFSFYKIRISFDNLFLVLLEDKGFYSTVKIRIAAR